MKASWSEEIEYVTDGLNSNGTDGLYKKAVLKDVHLQSNAVDIHNNTNNFKFGNI